MYVVFVEEGLSNGNSVCIRNVGVKRIYKNIHIYIYTYIHKNIHNTI